MNNLITVTGQRSNRNRSLPRGPWRASQERSEDRMLRTWLKDELRNFKTEMKVEIINAIHNMNFKTEMFHQMKVEIMNAIHNVYNREIGRFPPERKLRLKFIKNPKDTTFTEDELKAECGDNIQIALFGANNEAVTMDQLSNCQLEVVLLKGDFDTSDEDNWTPEQFENKIEKGRQGKGQLLVGQLKVCLRGGVGTLGSIRVMDNSSWTRSRTFRLGVRVSRENLFWERDIREGKSQPFNVKERRGKGQMKHGKPAVEDEVWRLEKISRSGKYRLKLNEFGIHKVKDFLVYNRIKPHILKEVMLPKHYQAAVEHAQNCVIGTLFLYKNKPVYLVSNNKNDLLGIFHSDDSYTSVEKLGNSAKKYQSLLKTASYVNTYAEPVCTRENQTATGEQLYGEMLLQNDIMRDTHVMGECSYQNLAYTTTVGECRHRNLAYTTVVGECSHQKTVECSQLMPIGAESEMLLNPVQHYVVENHCLEGASLVDKCDVFSHKEIRDATAEDMHSMLDPPKCITQQENYFAQEDVLALQLPDDISILNVIIMENNTFPDMKCNMVDEEFDHEFFWNSSLNVKADGNMDGFVGDPINIRTSSVWLKVWTFMRCAFLIRSAGNSSSFVHRSFTCQSNFHQDVIC